MPEADEAREIEDREATLNPGTVGEYGDDSNNNYTPTHAHPSVPQRNGNSGHEHTRIEGPSTMPE